jgi:hypothetical protein
MRTSRSPPCTVVLVPSIDTTRLKAVRQTKGRQSCRAGTAPVADVKHGCQTGEMEVSTAAKLAAKELFRTWGREARVMRHWDERENYSIHVAQCENSPIEGITAVGTAGLSDHDLGMGPVRVELIGAFPTVFKDGPNVAATCAFNAFKDRSPTRPDAIHRDVLSLYLREPTVPHIMMVDPFLWQNGPDTLTCEDFQVAWLMMVPISEAERLFATRCGPDVLTTLFAKHQIDIYDLARPSIV